jgi:mercuric reductase
MAKQTQFTLRIEGMTCDNCARHVTEALRGVPGVTDVRVGSWKSGQAAVVASSEVDDKSLEAAVEKAGYHAVVTEKRPVGEGRRVPSSGESFDLMTIGGGSAAFAAAIKAAELGARVAIIEKGTIGGTCVNVGCVPSKTLIEAAELCYHSAYPNFEGLTACPPPSDWRRVVQQKDELVATLRQDKYVHVAEQYPNITIIKGEARLTGGRSLDVNGRRYTPGKILIATGSHSWTPPIPGLAEIPYLDSTAALSLPELPESMIVVGAGSVGLELAQLFSRFGVRVMIFEAQPHLAAAAEPEIGRALTQYLEGEKIRTCTDAVIQRIDRKSDQYEVHAKLNGRLEICTAKQLLVATGRRPNTNGLGLESAGVQTGEHGEIVVDEYLQTSNRDLYAAGDCIGNPMYVYVAAHAGSLAAENALTGAGRLYDLSALPSVTFTDPQMATVGITESQARAQGLRIQTAVLNLKNVPRAQASRDTRGLIRACSHYAQGLDDECEGEEPEEQDIEFLEA